MAGNATTGDPGKLGPVWLAGLDDAGNVAWQRTFTGVNNYVTSLSTTPSGGFAVLMPSGTSNLGVNILTTDGSGQALWTASIGSDKQNIKTFGMAVTSQGFAVVGGYWDPKVPAPGTLNLGRVAHLDGSGQVVSEASDSEVAVWWMARSTPGMPIAYCGTLNDHQDQTRCVMESDDGKPIWQQDLALTWHPAHAAVRADGGLVLARLHEDTGPGRLPETSPGRIAVARLDPHGAVLWQTEHAWTVPAEMHVEDLVATADGGYALTGAMGDVLLVSAPYIGKAVPPGAIVWYWYALRGDATGRATWARGYAPGGGSGGQARALAPMCDGGIVQVGVAQLSNKPQFPSWVVRTDEMGKAPIALPGSTTQIAVP